MSLFAIINKESKDDYLNGKASVWCPSCGEVFIPSEEIIKEALELDGSAYCECHSCGSSFYLETED